ncbi:MAG TPA: PhaM family polyhydroxyalkanoate granule multifunctional regulatory protein [Caldimonas sp.]|nr:PhaM family polyhydroxyalkanoate granule multifunctional regulatory protein [Caldimonas sp.]
MNDVSGFGKLVPGFDFLQNLVKSAGSALPGIGQWVAPTLDPAEIEKRISELRTVQYWLEQNARMLAATIQALEVQRMTLTTLKTMNVPMADLTESLRIRPVRPKEPLSLAVKREPAPPAAKKEPAKPQSAVDPMQWWGALTTQFAQLATNAMKDTAADAAKALAGGMVKQSLDIAGQAMKTVGATPARGAAGAATKAAGGAAAAKRKRAKASRAKSAAPTT